MRHLLFLLLLCCGVAQAQTVGVAVPQSNTSNFNYDEVKTSSGATCRQAMGSNTAIEFGAVGSDSETDGSFVDETRSYDTDSMGNAVYARVTHFLGSPKRLDCSRLYELEIESLRAQLEQMRGLVVSEEVIRPNPNYGYVEVVE